MSYETVLDVIQKTSKDPFLLKKGVTFKRFLARIVSIKTIEILDPPRLPHIKRDWSNGYDAWFPTKR